MRAFSGSLDQTRPTIVLHGTELAIGPAGTDPHSEWGIHVEPPVDGRAQELREQLELSAQRLAGSKGNPPRLLDEVSEFERKATNMWAPGTPKATPSAEHRRADVYEPSDSIAARAAKVPASAPESQTMMGDPRAVPFSAPAASHQANKGGGFRSTPAPIHRSELAAMSAKTSSQSSKHGARSSGARAGSAKNPVAPVPRARLKETVIGFESGAGTLGTSKPKAKRLPRQSLAHLVGHTMPLGFSLDDEEREVLNALGRNDGLSASEVGELVGAGNGIAWMEALIGKLSEHGLDLIEPGEDRSGEPTYILRR